MQTKQIKQGEWKNYFDRLSSSLKNRPVSIEMNGLDIGKQVIADDISLIELSYNPKKDVFSISSESMEHLINSPVEVFVSHEAGDIDSMEIVDATQHHQIINFHHPLSLT